MPQAATAESLRWTALAACEDAIIKQGEEVGVSDEIEKEFEKYQKVKSLAIRGVDGEARNALKMALIAAVKLAF